MKAIYFFLFVLLLAAGSHVMGQERKLVMGRGFEGKEYQLTRDEMRGLRVYPTGLSGSWEHEGIACFSDHSKPLQYTLGKMQIGEQLILEDYKIPSVCNVSGGPRQPLCPFQGRIGKDRIRLVI